MSAKIEDSDEKQVRSLVTSQVDHARKDEQGDPLKELSDSASIPEGDKDSRDDLLRGSHDHLPAETDPLFAPAVDSQDAESQEKQVENEMKAQSIRPLM